MHINIWVLIIIIILALPVYFLYAWLHKRAMKWGFMSKKYMAYLPLLILTPALYVGLILLLFYVFVWR